MTSHQVFQKFVPPASINYCVKLYEKLAFEFKIKKARHTKMGDYRYNFQTGKQTITINNDLNPYAFLITYLHEVAHLLAFKNYGRSISPHGKEWKSCFQEIAKPMLTPEIFPTPILHALLGYFENPKASSCSDPHLYALLKSFDKDKNHLLLKDISNGDHFLFNKKHFQKLEKKRTRSICVEIATNRKYYISELADVTAIDNT